MKGPAINAADVERIIEAKGEWRDHAPHAVMRDGCVRELCGQSVEHVLERLRPVVKADPGYTLLLFWGCDGGETEEDFVSRAPIVAWRISGNNSEPVTPADHVFDDEQPYAILYPDGRAAHPYAATWRSEAA